jgi:hypothetical protein
VKSYMHRVDLSTPIHSYVRHPLTLLPICLGWEYPGLLFDVGGLIVLQDFISWPIIIISTALDIPILVQLFRPVRSHIFADNDVDLFEWMKVNRVHSFEEVR